MQNAVSATGLTARDFMILGAAFEPSEIGSNNGKPYVKPRAIKKRLRMIDPNYTTELDTYIQVIGDVVTVWGSLTLKGVRHAASKSKNVNCWRKVAVDANDPSKGQTYVRVDEYEYARELSFAIMKAQSGLLQRCGETFDVGDYLKDKSSPPPPPLATVLADLKREAPPQPAGQQPPTTTPSPVGAPTQPPQPETPKHWALNGDGEKIKARMNQLGLTGDEVLSQLEPGKVLAKLSDTTLGYDAVYHKMDEIKAAKVAAELDAKRQAQQSVKAGDPIKMRGDELQVNDLVYGLGGSKPKRLAYKLGEVSDGQFIYFAVWSNTDFMDNVTRMSFQRDLTFKVVRGEPVELPAEVLRQVEALKDEQASLSEV